MGHVISVPIYRSDANGQNRGRYISSWNTFNSARSAAARHTITHIETSALYFPGIKHETSMCYLPSDLYLPCVRRVNWKQIKFLKLIVRRASIQLM